MHLCRRAIIVTLTAIMVSTGGSGMLWGRASTKGLDDVASGGGFAST